MRTYRWRDGARNLGIMATFALSILVGADRALAQTGEHRWAGIVFDAFAWDTGSGVEAWTVEDGGRIRHRDPSNGVWEFQDVPAAVKDTLHRVMFLTSGSQAGDLGWAVGQGGWVLNTDDGGDEWVVLAHIDTQLTGGTDPDEELYDIHFVDADDGWLAGKHSLWWSDDGGINWTKADVWDPGASSFLDLADYELYALDVVQRGDGSRLGLAVMEPGIVLRSTSAVYGANLETWEVVFDIRDLCPTGGDVEDCQNATGGILKGCECEVCAPSEVGGPHFEPWDVEISRHATQPLALFTGGIVFQCGMMFASTDDGLTWEKEWHECTCTGSGCINCESQLYYALYHDDPGDPDDINCHLTFKTLYGLGIQEGNNSAIAAGYNGQLIVRDPATGVWKDRSIFSPAIPTTTGCVKYPMSGAEALAGSWTPSSGSGFGIVTGMGGHILETTDGGSTYDIDFEVHGEQNVIGEPHRTHCLHFDSFTHGWQGGQLFRIAFSGNEGVTWEEQEPSPTAAIDQKCLAIAFEPDGQVGVAVGERITDFIEDVTHPIILYTNDGGASNGWSQDSSISVSPAYGDNDLVEATWAPGDRFWAVGTGGLILYSDTGGASWSQFVPSGQAGTNQPYFQVEGVTFLDSTNGVFVGVRPEQITSGALRGVAFHNQNANPASWNSIAMPSGLTITGLFDVAWGETQSATSVWAVGEKLVNGVTMGTVLRADWSGSSFGAFEEEHEFPDCLTGDELDESKALTEIEVAPVTDDVWVGGKCGRVWVGRASTGWSQWVEVKSMTSAHVSDFSFVVDAQDEPVGYVNGFRTGPLQQCIVRVRD